MQLRRNAEGLPQAVDLVGRDAEEQRAEPGVDRRQEHQHSGHARIDVPVRRRPARLVSVSPALVGLGITVEVGQLVRQTHDQQGHVVQVGPLKGVRIVGPDSVPVGLGLLATVEHEERPALAVTG
jgi:hypothetical protein